MEKKEIKRELFEKYNWDEFFTEMIKEDVWKWVEDKIDKAREEEREKISGHLLKVKSYGEEYSKDSNCDCNYLNGWNDCLKEIKKYLN